MKIAYLALILAVAPGVAQAADATKAIADQAVAGAQTALGRATKLDDQWTATVAAFNAAETAMQKRDYSTALTQAKLARRLADLSIKQATAQKKLWRNEVVR